MTIKRIFYPTLVFGLFLLTMNSCRKTPVITPVYEPITVIAPDTSYLKVKHGQSVQLDVKFTTDRPLDTVRIRYNVDPTGTAIFNSSTSHLDTFYFKKYLVNQATNQDEYQGVFIVPDSLKYPDVIHLLISMKARADTNTSTQTRYYEKELRLVLK